MKGIKFTPGPWKCEYGAVWTEDNKPIARAVRDDSALEAGIYPVERDQNVKLIALAPTMFDALRVIANVPLRGEEGGFPLDSHDAAGLIRIARRALADIPEDWEFDVRM